MKKSISYITKNYSALESELVTIQGWIRTNRNQKEFGFINFNDGSNIHGLQIVYDKTLDNFDLQEFEIYDN